MTFKLLFDNLSENATQERNSTQVMPTLNETYLPLILLGFLSCLIVIVNSLVIVLVSRNKQLQTVTNLCLACLALSDLLSGLVAIPLIFACNLTVSDGLRFCIAMDLASRFIAISTILHLLVVTFERYVMIIYPMRYYRIVSKQRIGALMMFVWTFSLAVSLIQLIWISLGSTQTPNELYSDVIYSYSCFVGLVALPLLLLAAAYGRIFLVLRGQLRKIRRQLSHIRNSRSARQKRGQKRAVTILASMILAFIFGWFSYFLSSIFQDENIVVHFPPAVNILLLFMRFGTSLVNPLLYTLFKEDFRSVLRLFVFRDEQNHLNQIPLSTKAGRATTSD